MKKIVLALALTFALGGCAQVQKAADFVAQASKSVSNPVSRADLDKAEAVVELVFTGLKTYKRACVQGLADKSCRANIAAVQVYTRKLPPVLKNVRKFVDSGDEVNAITAYNTLMALIKDVKNEAYLRKIEIKEPA